MGTRNWCAIVMAHFFWERQFYSFREEKKPNEYQPSISQWTAPALWSVGNDESPSSTLPEQGRQAGNFPSALRVRSRYFSSLSNLHPLPEGETPKPPLPHPRRRPIHLSAMTLGSSGAGSSVVGEESAPLLLLLFPDGYLSPEISRSDPVLLQFWPGAPALDLAPRDPIRVRRGRG
jgi:hypothetical protein